MSTASNVAYILWHDEFIFAFVRRGNKIQDGASWKSVFGKLLLSLPNLRLGLQTFSRGHCRSFLISWQTLLI